MMFCFIDPIKFEYNSILHISKDLPRHWIEKNEMAHQSDIECKFISLLDSISFSLYRLFCQHQTKKKMCFEIVCNPLTRHWIEKNEMAHQSKCKFTMKGKKIIEEKKPISPSLIAFYAHVQYIIVVVNGKCGVEYI